MGSLKTNRKWLPEGWHRKLGEKNVIKRDRKKKTKLHILTSSSSKSAY